MACVDLLVGEDLNPPPRGKRQVWKTSARGVLPAASSLTPPSASFQKHEFFVDMTCEGCSNAVTRVLHRLGGESVLGV